MRLPDTPEPDGLPTPRRYLAMLAIAIGITISVLDTTIVNVALPTLARALGASPAASVWVVTAYQLVIVAGLLPLAALGERIGYRRVYQGGLVLFTLGSAACALSHSLPLLVAARALQGVGAAGIMSMNGALVRYTYPQASLGRGIGLNALILSFAAAVAPTVASGILAVGPWPWLFAVNVPFGLLNIYLALRFLPASHRSAEPFDRVSAGLNAVMFGLFFIGATTLSHGGGQWPLAAAEMAAAAAAGVVLFRRAAGARDPLIPIDLMRIPIFALSMAASVCAFAANALAFLALPFYFIVELGRDQVQAGLMMTPWPVAVGLVAPLAGRLADRVPAGLLGGVGMGVLAAGLALLSRLSPDSSIIDIGWRMALCGAGFGLFQTPNNRTMLSAAPRERAGSAGGLLATARLVGATGGATAAAFVFRWAPERAEPVALTIGAGLAVAAGAASLLRLSAPKGG